MPRGNLRHRPGWRILNKILHPGDQLSLLGANAFGNKPKNVRRNHQKLDGQGIQVAFVVANYFEEPKPYSNVSENLYCQGKLFSAGEGNGSV